MPARFRVDDRQPEPAARGGGTAATSEPVDHSLTFGDRNPGTVILDHDLRTALNGGDPKSNVPTGASVAGRVLEQILDDPPKAVRVSLHHRARRRQGAVHHQLGMPSTCCEYSPVGDVTKVDLGGGGDQPGLAASERLQTVDQTTEPIGLQRRRLERVPALLGVRVLPPGDVEVRAHALQWGPQFVTGVGRESACCE